MSSFADALGLDLPPERITAAQMALRAVLVFVAAIAMVRLGHKRFMGKSTALDVMLGIVFGSVVSRAITGTSPFVPTLAAGLVLVALHWVLSALAFRSHAFGFLFKGTARLLVRDGEVLWDAMRRSHVSQRDLEEALRLHGVSDVGLVRLAHIERNGDISIVLETLPPPPQPRRPD